MKAFYFLFFFKIIRHACKTYIVRREKAIIKVYEYFKLEAEKGRLRIRILDYAKRTGIFKLSKSTLRIIIQAKDNC